MTNDFSINQENPNEYLYGIDDIKQCWSNIMRTIPGTIPLMPTFGCDLFQYVDKPITTSFSEAANKIVAALTKWEKRTKITKVSRVLESSRIYIKIEGIYTSTGESIIAKYDLSKLFNVNNDLLFVMQPININVVETQTATFNVLASGKEPITYQWQEYV